MGLWLELTGIILAVGVLAALVTTALRALALDRATWNALEGKSAPTGWSHDVDAIRQGLGIDRTVRTVSAHPEDVSGPAEMRGRRWPVLVLNSDFADLVSPNERRAVMAHELGHLRRYDRARRAVAGAVIGAGAGAIVWPAVEVSAYWLALLALAPFLLFAAHRHCEFGADCLAVEATRDPQALIESIWKADAFEAKQRGKSPTPRQAVSRWDADDLVAPHPAPGRRQLAVERHWRAQCLPMTR